MRKNNEAISILLYGCDTERDLLFKNIDLR